MCCFWTAQLLHATSCGVLLCRSVSWETTIPVLHVWLGPGPDCVSHGTPQISGWVVGTQEQSLDLPTSLELQLWDWLEKCTSMYGQCLSKVFCTFQASPYFNILTATAFFIGKCSQYFCIVSTELWELAPVTEVKILPILKGEYKMS